VASSSVAFLTQNRQAGASFVPIWPNISPKPRTAGFRGLQGGFGASRARYAVFYSLADGADGGRYYEVHKIENMRHALTILAYDMNGAPVSIVHGAPLRLRCENELGFKMVKWIAAIEFVSDFADLGAGQGGYNEDHEFCGYRTPI
jgi:hypothetical protein